MKHLQDFFTIYKESAWNKDAQRMIELYDEDIVIFDMWSKGYQTGLKDWTVVIKDWLGSLGEERVNVSFDLIEIHEGDTAGFANALISFQAISIDKKILRSMTNRITVGFIKKDGAWKVRHQHTSAPINSELQAILNL